MAEIEIYPTFNLKSISLFFIPLNKKNYENITITDIAERAGVTRITFYRNFNTKDDIVKQYVQNIFNEYKWNDKLDM